MGRGEGGGMTMSWWEGGRVCDYVMVGARWEGGREGGRV